MAEDPAGRTQLLQQALLAAKSGDAIAALEHLVRAWRAGPAQPIAEAVAEVGRAAARGRWPADPEEKKGAHARWMEVAARRHPADLSLLLETLWHEGKFAQLRKRCTALTRFAPDPRLAPALLTALEKAPWGGARSNYSAFDVEVFWNDFFEVLKAVDDPRVPALAAKLVERSTKPFEPLGEERLRAARLVPSRQEVPLSPDDASLCQAIAAALHLEAGEATEEDFLAQIWERPQDDGLRQVYADWLVERGDPRGEFIALQYARLSGPLTREQETREAELLTLHRERWLGALARKVQVPTARFERGFAAEVSGAETDAAREWATVRTLHCAVPGDATPVGALERLLDIADLTRFERRRLPLPIVELHWTSGSGAKLGRQLEQLERLPPLPNLRRLDLTGSFGGADSRFFDWIWRSRLGTGLEELAVSTVPKALEEWLGLMEARSLRRLELALPSVGRVAIAVDGPVRSLVFLRPGARGGLSPHLGESFAKDAAAVLKLVPPGSVQRVEIDLGRPKLSPKLELTLREGLEGRGVGEATVLLETGARRGLL